MPQRTIAEARQVLETHKAVMHPEVWGEHDQEVRTAEREATVKAHTFITDRFTVAAELGTTTITAVCDVRDRARALAAAAKAGQLSPREANAQLNALRDEHRRIAGQAQSIAGHADDIEAIENDPVGWVDSMNVRFPNTRPRFQF